MESMRKKRLLAAFVMSAIFINASAQNITSCYQGYTGENDGGSCTFIPQFRMCGWKQDSKSQEWILLRDGIGLKSTTDNNNNAQLIGPMICEKIGIELCVQIRISFPEKSKRHLFFFLKMESNSTNNTLVGTNQNGTKKQNISISIPFESPGQFQMVFEVDLGSHVIKPDEDFQIHSILYHNTSCLASSSTVLPSTSTFTTKTSALQSTGLPEKLRSYAYAVHMSKLITVIIFIVVAVFVIILAMVLLWKEHQKESLCSRLGLTKSQLHPKRQSEAGEDASLSGNRYGKEMCPDSINQESRFLPTGPSDYWINKDKTTHNDYCGKKGDDCEQECDKSTHKQTTKDNIHTDRGAAASVEAVCCSGSTIVAVHTNGLSQTDEDHYSTLGHHKTLPYIDEWEGDTYHHLKQQTNTDQPSADACVYNALGSTNSRSRKSGQEKDFTEALQDVNFDGDDKSANQSREVSLSVYYSSINNVDVVCQGQATPSEYVEATGNQHGNTQAFSAHIKERKRPSTNTKQETTSTSRQEVKTSHSDYNVLDLNRKPWGKDADVNGVPALEKSVYNHLHPGNAPSLGSEEYAKLDSDNIKVGFYHKVPSSLNCNVQDVYNHLTNIS